MSQIQFEFLPLATCVTFGSWESILPHEVSFQPRWVPGQVYQDILRKTWSSGGLLNSDYSEIYSIAKLRGRTRKTASDLQLHRSLDLETKKMDIYEFIVVFFLKISTFKGSRSLVVPHFNIDDPHLLGCCYCL
jgi:hypothetical protein